MGVSSKEFLLTPVLYLCVAIHTGVFSKEFLLTPILYLCFAIRTGVFLNDVQSGILILIANMALKIQNDVKSRKTMKKWICQYFRNAKQQEARWATMTRANSEDFIAKSDGIM